MSFFIEDLLAHSVIWKLVYFADFDGMPTVPFEHFAGCLHVFANERLQRILPGVRHGFRIGRYTEPSFIRIPNGEPALAHVVMQSLL